MSDLRSKLLHPYRFLPFRVKHSLRQALDFFVNPHLSYAHWIRYCEHPTSDPKRIEQEIKGFRYTPKISIVMPVYNTPPRLLDLAIRSVRLQRYKNWDLCICDDASTERRIRATLRKWQARDSRIKVIYSENNEHISGASNRALTLATGEFIGLLDHDDEITSDALFENVKLLQQHPDADMIYSDEDKLTMRGRRVNPLFKPDWSPEYMLENMYTIHFGLYRKRLIDEIGGFRKGFEGSQDYDLVLRLVEKTEKIYHIPKILYHWRMAPGSGAASSDAKPYGQAAAKRAISQHLQRRSILAEIVDARWPGDYRVKFNLRDIGSVSIIVIAGESGDALRNCLASIVNKTAHSNFELLIAADEKAIQPLENSPHARVVPCEKSSSFSARINSVAAHAHGPFLLFLHDDVEVISEDWIASMLGFCQQPEIGAVGAKLLHRDHRIQHAGVIVGLKGTAGQFLRNASRVSFDAVHNFSAVSGACMMVRKQVFDEIGGFDEKFPNVYADIDFCLRLRQMGYRIVCTPHAELYHDEHCLPVSADNSELPLFRERWNTVIGNDPYFNPNLSLHHESLGYRVKSDRPVSHLAFSKILSNFVRRDGNEQVT